MHYVRIRLVRRHDESICTDQVRRCRYNLQKNCEIKLGFTVEDCLNPEINPKVAGRPAPSYDKGSSLDSKSLTGEKPCHGHVELLYYLDNQPEVIRTFTVNENKDCLVTINNLSGKVYKTTVKKTYAENADEN